MHLSMYNYIFLVTHSVLSWGMLQQHNTTHSAPGTHSYESANVSGTPHFFNRSFWILNTKLSCYKSWTGVYFKPKFGWNTSYSQNSLFTPPPTASGTNATLSTILYLSNKGLSIIIVHEDSQLHPQVIGWIWAFWLRAADTRVLSHSHVY